MTEELIEIKWISGFWKRIGALFIDTLILAFFGYILGMVFENIFVAIGDWGRLIGFSIALIYFGIMNSKLFGGQTIGKKLLNIKVVNLNNENISIVRSFGRYAVFSVPFFLNGAHFTNEAMTSYLTYPLSLIIFGGVLSTIYLYVFNRLTRQSLHDLVFGTFVVNQGVEAQKSATIWRTHIIVVFILFIAAAIAPIFTEQLAKAKPFKDLLVAQAALAKDPSVSYVSIFTGSTSFSSFTTGKSTTTYYVSAQVFLKKNTVNDVDFARKLAKLIVVNYPEAKTSNKININLTYGYDIGISSKWNNYIHSFNPADLSGSE